MEHSDLLKIRVSGKRKKSHEEDKHFQQMVHNEWKARQRMLKQGKIPDTTYQKPNIDTTVISRKMNDYDKKIKALVDKIQRHPKTFAAAHMEAKLLQACNTARRNTLTFVDAFIRFATSTTQIFAQNTQTIRHIVDNAQSDQQEAMLAAIERVIDDELVHLTDMEQKFFKQQKDVYCKHFSQMATKMDTMMGNLSETDSLYTNLVSSLWELEYRRFRFSTRLNWPH